jgi:hypothetical protein
MVLKLNLLGIGGIGTIKHMDELFRKKKNKIFFNYFTRKIGSDDRCL